MLREKVTSLIVKSVKEELNLDDYSTVYFKALLADKFMKGGIFDSATDAQNLSYLIGYTDGLELDRLYNEALQTEERFNNFEIHFDKDLNPSASFTWDQDFYDADVAGNKKLKKKK